MLATLNDEVKFASTGKISTWAMYMRDQNTALPGNGAPKIASVIGPPITGSESSSTTSRPSWADSMAAERPAIPAPTTQTSGRGSGQWVPQIAQTEVIRRA